MSDRNVKKRKLGSYPYFSVVLTIALALLMMGLFGLITLHAKRLTAMIQQNVEIQVFLNKPIQSNEVTRIQKTILSKDYINNGENAGAIAFITKEEAAKDFIEETGEDFSEFLGDNPLRDLFVVKIDPTYQSVDSLQMVKKDIEDIRGVFEVTYVETLVSSINNNLAKIGIILIGIAAIFLIVVVILINNTIKLALFSQRFLIRSMQLVGATGSFIKKPFVNRALGFGFLAGLLSSVVLFLIMMYANSRIEDLKELQRVEDLAILFATLVVLGIIVAYVSTYRAVNKYLKISLDELY